MPTSLRGGEGGIKTVNFGSDFVSRAETLAKYVRENIYWSREKNAKKIHPLREKPAEKSDGPRKKATRLKPAKTLHKRAGDFFHTSSVFFHMVFPL